MNLLEMLSDFQKILLDPSCPEPAWARQHPVGPQARERMRIYHNAYRVRLVDVLRDTFEHTAVYLGNDWFDQQAQRYVERVQSIHSNIGQYGHQFADYLATEYPNDPDIAELANMDWTLRRAFDGPDSAVMTTADLQELSREGGDAARLTPVPTMRLVRQQYNTLAIWQAIDNDEHPPAARRLPIAVDILCWRREHAPHYRSVRPFEAQALTNLAAGQSLQAIGAALRATHPDADVATEFGTLLMQWLDEELLAGWSVAQ